MNHYKSLCICFSFGVDCYACCKMVAHKLLHQNQYVSA